MTRVDAHALGRISAEKAFASARPRTVDPGEWTVILEPAAFGESFTYLADHFSAQSFDEGSSFLSDGLGKTYLGENVTIADDYAHPLAPGMPFDYEGQPTQRLALIENGIAKTVVTDSYWAHKLGRENTGHAWPAPNAYGPQATHLVVSPGTKPVAELIAQTERGLLISRFWYIRTVDQKKGYRHGHDARRHVSDRRREDRRRRAQHALQSKHSEALRRCEFSNALRRTGGYAYSVVVPAAKIERFTFSSGTDF